MTDCTIEFADAIHIIRSTDAFFYGFLGVLAGSMLNVLITFVIGFYVEYAEAKNEA